VPLVGSSNNASAKTPNAIAKLSIIRKLVAGFRTKIRNIWMRSVEREVPDYHALARALLQIAEGRRGTRSAVIAAAPHEVTSGLSCRLRR
jgi:hypothetical protein